MDLSARTCRLARRQILLHDAASFVCRWSAAKDNSNQVLSLVHYDTRGKGVHGARRGERVQACEGDRVDPPRVYYIVSGKRAITAATALGLARYFGTSAEFWLNLQTHYTLEDCDRPGLGEHRDGRAQPLAR